MEQVINAHAKVAALARHFRRCHIAPLAHLCRKYIAANGSRLNAEQRRNGLPLFGAIVTSQRAHTPRADDVRRQLKPMLPVPFG